MIIFPPPLLNQYLSFLKSGKYLPVQQIISKLTVKRFNITILPRTAKFDEEGFNTQPGQPFAYLPGGELRAVVGANMLRDAPENRHYVWIVLS